jgi:hypothetical protein
VVGPRIVPHASEYKVFLSAADYDGHEVRFVFTTSAGEELHNIKKRITSSVENEYVNFRVIKLKSLRDR